MRPAPPWCTVQVFCDNEQQEWENLFWYSVSGSFPAPYDSNADADAFRSHFQSPYTGIMTDAAHFVGLKMLINIAGVIYSGAAYNGSAGNISMEPEPAEVCAVARVQSVHGGRTGRGRHYFAGLDASSMEESRITAPNTPPWSTLAAAIAAPVTLPSGITATPKLWSRKDNTLYAINTVAFDAVLGHRRKLRPVF